MTEGRDCEYNNRGDISVVICDVQKNPVRLRSRTTVIKFVCKYQGIAVYQVIDVSLVSFISSSMG